MKWKYSERVDPHIYGPEKGCETPEDWLELAIAALDQGGWVSLIELIKQERG